ncbi:MAG: DedA family protein [Alicyclobacillus sp.]|nr:DedA family protein [Alicyclobacillus sp.]
MSAHLSNLVAHYGYIGVFILMTLESACIPIPSEAVMPYAGYLSFTHTLSFWAVVLIGTLANVVGGLIAYGIGKAGGRPLVLHYGRYILLNQRHLERAEQWFDRHGEWTVLICRLLPALRTFISLPAGIAEMKLGRFVLYSALGSLPWNFALTYAGYYLGKHWEQIGHYIKPLTYLGVLLLVLAVLWFWFGKRRTASYRNRT